MPFERLSALLNNANRLKVAVKSPTLGGSRGFFAAGGLFLRRFSTQVAGRLRPESQLWRGYPAPPG